MIILLLSISVITGSTHVIEVYPPEKNLNCSFDARYMASKDKLNKYICVEAARI